MYRIHYHRPASVADAASWLGKHGDASSSPAASRIVAAMKLGLLAPTGSSISPASRS